MSTHGLRRRKRKSPHLFASAAFSILLIVLQLILFSSSPVVAASVHRAAAAPPSEAVARAGPSVVRLLVTYSTSPAPATMIQCTGLGTIVASWAAQTSADQNTWVLTDGTLVNPNGEASCVPTHPKAKLVTIEVVLSSAYNPQGVAVSLVAPSSPANVRCSTVGACQKGAALFVFSTRQAQTLPFLDLTTLDSIATQPAGIELSKTAVPLNIPRSSVGGDGKTALQFLTPVGVPLSNSLPPPNTELGLPLVDLHGHLVSMLLKSSTLFSTPEIGTFLTQQIKLPAQPDNAVHDNWNAAITAFYQGQSHYAEANTAFKAVLAANPQFLGAQSFMQLTSSPASLSSTSGQPSNPGLGSNSPGKSGFNDILSRLGIPIGIAVVLLLLAFLLLRRWLQQRERDRQYKEAEKLSEITMEQIRRENQARNQQQMQRRWAELPSLTPETVPAAFGQPISAPWPCPNCQQPIQRGITRCPYCGTSSLMPTDPGFYPRTQFAMPPHVLPVQTKSESVIGQPVISNAPRCPNCSKPVPDSAKYCPNCRLPLSPSLSGPQVSVQPSPSPTVPIRPNGEVKPLVPASPILPVSERLQPDKSVAPVPPTESSPVPAEQIVQNRPKEIVRANDRVGQRLGNYRLVRLLGYGAFADVYLGEHRFLKTQAAIKVLQKRLTRDALVNFLAEARTIADLIHPHIVRVLEFGVEGSEPDIEQSVSDGEAIVDGIPFLVMDYAPGGTLRKRHPKGTRLSPATIVPYVMQVAEALQYAHGKKLIHRDVKAENILVGRNGEILLSDFGIAAVAHSEHSMTTQEMAGTVPYMAPEQIRGKPRPASDQYALGVVVYEWLCGTRPFNGASIEVIMQHMTLSPPCLCEHVPSLSPKVKEVVLRALAKDPLQRFESVQAFANALKQAAE